MFKSILVHSVYFYGSIFLFFLQSEHYAILFSGYCGYIISS